MTTDAQQLLSELDLDITTHDRGSALATQHGIAVIELAKRGDQNVRDSLLLTPQLAVQIGKAGERIQYVARSRETFNALPVTGYTPRTGSDVDLVNEGKVLEERLLRYIDKVMAATSHGPDEFPSTPVVKDGDPRFAAIGRTQVQLGMMMIYRAIFNPPRLRLPEDA